MLQNEINNAAIAATVQNNIINVCNILSPHYSKWKTLLTEADKPVKALVNYSEQLRHVETANIKYIDGFKDLQEKLLYKIFCEIEDEMILVKDIISRMNAANQDLKNKFSMLEKSTIDLDWDEQSELIIGTAFQPPLYKILQEGYEYIMFFTNAFKSINESFKTLNVRNEKIMIDFESKFKLDFDSNCVLNHFLAIVQYVGNKSL